MDFIKKRKFRKGTLFQKKSDDPQLDYFETPNGKYYLPKNSRNDSVAIAIRQGKVFDQHIIDVAKEYIRPGTSILDIGANYGQMSIEFSRLAPDCDIYAFEAQEMVFEILKKNLKVNDINNVKTFYNAVYDVNDKEFIFPVPDLVRFGAYGSYGLDLKAQEGKVVKSLTIDSIQFEKPVSFMKVDIQGSDLAAMKGAIETIKKYKMPIIFEYEEQFQAEFNTSFQQYVDFVASIDYRFVKTVEAINYLIVPK